MAKRDYYQVLDLPRTANDEIAIAAGGPAVSLGLAGLGFGLGAVAASPLLGLIGWINLVIAGFNLIPALPMDGGRILRALLTRRLDYVRATEAAVQVSRVAAVAFALFGLAYGSFQLVLLAPLLWVMGTRERALARHVGHLYGRGAHGYRAHGGTSFETAPPSYGPRRFVIYTPQGRFIVHVDQ